MHILIVEDELTTAEYLRQGFEESGFAVAVAHRGDDAVMIASSTELDLIILDLMIPGLDGMGVCRSLRAKKSRIPILMLTARDGVEDRIRGLDAGADDYLVKPFSFQELKARTRALLRRSAQAVGFETSMTIADLSIDTRTKAVERAGMSVKLTAKETAILECLLRDKERIFTRVQISDHVWGMDAPSESNVIDVYIRNLRRKIDDPFDRKLIQTVKGLGYRISEKQP